MTTRNPVAPDHSNDEEEVLRTGTRDGSAEPCRDTTRRSPQLHTPAEAADILTVKESWLRRQAGLRRVPCTFLGKHLRFSDADLRAIVEAGTRPARPQSKRTYRR